MNKPLNQLGEPKSKDSTENRSEEKPLNQLGTQMTDLSNAVDRTKNKILNQLGRAKTEKDKENRCRNESQPVDKSLNHLGDSHLTNIPLNQLY